MIKEYEDDKYEIRDNVNNKDVCFWIIFGIILLLSISFIVWLFGNGYLRRELVELQDTYGLVMDSDKLFSNILIDGDTSPNSTFVTSVFGSRIKYYLNGLLSYYVSSYFETSNLVNNDGTINIKNSQAAIVTSSETNNQVRGLCQDSYGSIGIGTFDGNGTKCTPNSKLDVKGNVTVDTFLALSTNIKTYTCNNTQYTNKVLQIGSEKNDVIVIKANQKVLIETSGQIICFDDLIFKLNNLTDVLNRVVTKNNLAS